MGLPSRERRRRALALLAARLCRPHAEEANAHGGQPPGGEQRVQIGDVLEKMCLGDFLREKDDAPRPLDPVNDAAVTTPERGGGGGSGGSRRGGRRGKKAGSSSSSPAPRCLLSRWLPSKQFLKCRVCEGEYDEEEEEVAEEEDVVESEGGCGSCVFSLRSEVGASTMLSAGRAEAALASASIGGQDSAYTEERKTKDSDFGGSFSVLP